MTSWWRHQMETFSALLAICAGNSPVPVEFPAQRPVMRSFDAYFDLRLNKRLSKQSWSWWYETLSHPLWRHCNVDSKVHGANMGPTWVLSAPDGPHVGPMNLAIREVLSQTYAYCSRLGRWFVSCLSILFLTFSDILWHWSKPRPVFTKTPAYRYWDSRYEPETVVRRS